ncbi:glycosyl hydrolase family 18 protein [Alicyclobacillus macrosporangiidus]|uniref:glycosyl hydrolase family 18 protein n=2 Tax=Alicyclobacillus macrosporangiidus TaxID=392015 RepID=UPI0004981C81|nr:glycosyl hydrolase family 18 protein [Alicyclobacillus macrosporangiidus]
MRVYTVVAGDELRAIADRVEATTRDLVRWNELAGEDVLVPGLHLLVPGPATLAQTYRVRRGEDLTQAARRLGVSLEELESYSQIRQTTGPQWQAGQTVLVPRRVTQKRTIEVNGYLLPQGTPTDSGILQDVGRWLSYLSIFSYQARADGTLVETKDNIALEVAKRYGIAPLMTVSNFDGNTFNTELAHTILANGSIRRRLFDHIMRLARSKGFRGINVDFEHMRPTDRPLYNQFIRELGRIVRPAGMSLSIALGPKTSDDPMAQWMGAFDYRTLGAEVDFLMLMTYEWGWVGGPPMAVAPLNQVRAVLDYATSVIPPQKILMGISLYGYDWPLPYPAGGRASGIANNTAQNLAIREQVPIQWEHPSASPFFRYRTRELEERVVWFDDALSVSAKLNLVYEYNLRGVSYWVLGNSFPQNWYLLDDSFEVRKV